MGRITSVKSKEYRNVLEIASIQFAEYEIYVSEKHIFSVYTAGALIIIVSLSLRFIDIVLAGLLQSHKHFFFTRFKILSAIRVSSG